MTYYLRLRTWWALNNLTLLKWPRKLRTWWHNLSHFSLWRQGYDHAAGRLLVSDGYDDPRKDTQRMPGDYRRGVKEACDDYRTLTGRPE